MEISKDSLNYGAAEGSSDHPAPVGTTVKTTIERGDAYLSPDIFNVEITLLEIVRGEEARERIGAAQAGDRPPQTGFEYVLALVRFGYSRRTSVVQVKIGGIREAGRFLFLKIGSPRSRCHLRLHCPDRSWQVYRKATIFYVSR